MMPASTDQWLTCTIDGPTASVLHLVDFGSAANHNSIRTVTVTRTIAGVTTAVRGADQAPAGGGYHAAIDHEPALGLQVRYQAFAYNAGGAQLYASTVVPILVPFEPYTAWLKCLQIPRLSRRVNVNQYPDWDNDVTTSVNYRFGQAYPTVGQDVQQAGQGTLSLTIRDATSRDDLRALLAVGGTYLLQPSQESTEPDVYLTRGKTTRARPFQLSSQPKRLFTFPIVEVARPGTTGSVVQLPGRTAAEAPARPASTFTGRAVDWTGR